MEKIGKVVLDTACYPGEDLYSDGAVEDRILELVRTYPEQEYNQVIAREQDWAVMYHLAHERGNILSWYPFEPGSKLLEIGSGCGAVTGAAAASAASVTCVDLSMKRSTINGVRHQDRENIKICVGNFQDIEKGLEQDFDYATLIGVFEYGRGYMEGEKPYHKFLTTVMNHLRPGGKLLIAIENKLGLKYWAGCREDHTGTFFEGLEGYHHTEGVRTFSRPELIRILEECGYEDYRFYYPYPDYKFPTVIYSDEYLPGTGELNRNICNFDRNRLVLMDEGRVFDQLSEDGLFPLYANSFFVEITNPSNDGESEKEQVLYTKYSTGRAPEFAIRTCIGRDVRGGYFLYKTAEYPQGRHHIQSAAKAGAELEKLWEGKGMLRPNRCRLEDGRVFFEYLKGTTLEEKLDRLLEQGEEQQVREWMEAAFDRILAGAPTQEFQITPEFQQVFGQVSFQEPEPAFPAADVDLIFSNLLLTEDGSWHVLDYEWTFFFPIPAGYVLWRAFHYYTEGAEGRKKLKEDLTLCRKYGISGDREEQYKIMEQNFQAYIRKGYVPAGELYRTMGKQALPLGELLAETDRRRIQVYLDYGQGFSEEQSFFLDQGVRQEITAELTIPAGVSGLWLDPALSPCMLKDVKLFWIGSDGQTSPVKYGTTGFEMEKNCYLFDNSDPKIIIEEIPEENRRMKISWRISILEEETAVMLMDRLNARGRMKKKVRGLLRGQEP